ncbi:cell division protein FtsQ/DivIB [Yanghanlia caeni]|uniref:Cell division protein FtsQ n=1 Tax=Yanghanlia caeni TaxID=3064283 RepID=A0ABU1D846_9BURK|nr:cell division protein FtsQ/DivIB [Alcaligenaceae bacterium LG-2]NGR09724.1 FtsQ-type POTRA domain-containing protein [bacterium SGD-2]HZH56077.1 cell division protein FtsQ/DivIB [Burkholderiaceae bacterium]
MLHDARLINFIANSLALLAVSALLVGAVVWVAQRPYFVISTLRLAPIEEGSDLRFVTASSLGEAIKDKLRGNFFFIDLDETRRLIETTPWVRHARVQRVWPNALAVYVEEHQPLALWNENEMINTWGEAFQAYAAELPEGVDLPHLKGPDDSERLVVQRYAEVARWFAPLNLRVDELTLSPRYAWEMTLSDGMRLTLGRDPAADIADPHGRSGALPFAARIERFVEAWPRLVQSMNGRAIAHADLRYPNGFAITLAPVTPTPSN